MTKTTLIFDLDGTIVHSAPDLTHAVNHVLVPLSHKPLSVAEITGMIGNGMPKLMERGLAARGVECSEAEFQEHFDDLRTYYETNSCVDTIIFPGAVEMLEKVRDEGCLTAICTNKLETITRTMLEELKLAHLFDGVVGSEPPRPRKPAADPVYLAIERAGGTRENSIMIGDSPADIGAGKAAGLVTIAVSYGYTNVPPDELGADLLIDRLDQVFDAVRQVEPMLTGQADELP